MSDSTTSSNRSQRPSGRDSLLSQPLTYRSGIYYAIRVVVNLRAPVWFRDDDGAFPLHPSAERWDDQGQSFFTGLATLDLVNALPTLVFASPVEIALSRKSTAC